MKKYKIRFPLNVGLCISMLLIALIWMIHLFDRDNNSVVSFVGIVVCLAILSTLIIRRFFLKPRTLQFEKELLVIGHATLQARNISNIFIDGKIIGLKPQNNKIVPVNYCFKFIDIEQGMASLLEWAERNQVEIIRRKFIRWI